MRRHLALLAALTLIGAAAALTFTKLVDLRTDMADFLPPGGTPAARFLLREVQSGAAASLLLIGIEGAGDGELARISQALTSTLRADPAFRFVSNGAQGLDGGEEAFLFGHRYLLSPATTAAAFGPDALRARLEDILRQLAGSAEPLVKRYAFADPTGAFLAVAREWIGSSEIAMREGVWMAPDRALVLARSSAGSLDIEAQRRAIGAVEAAFAATGPGASRLMVSGPGVFAVRSADAIEADVRLVSILATALIAIFLIARYRSLHVLAAVAIPLAAGTVAAALLVQAVFGFVHGITLGFGMTMLGVAVDYPLLLLGQRRPGEAPLATARRLGPTLALAVGAAALGLTVMLFSSFPGLSQLGLFAATGLAAAAAVTRWLLPHLVAGARTRDQTVPAGLGRVADGLGRGRPVVLAVLAAATVGLLGGGAPRWETDLANLGPIPATDRDLDGELRRQIGAPDVRHLVAITGTDAEAVLRASERLDGALRRLEQAGDIGGAELPSRLLPSVSSQEIRRAALPEPATLEASLAGARAGLPYRPDAFAPFVADVATQRGMPPVERSAITSPALDARLDPILGRSADGWFGLAALIDVADPTAVARAVAALADPALTYVDIKAETERMLTDYVGEALRWLAAGAAVLVLVLVATLRRPALILRVALPVAGSLIVTLAVLGALDVRFTMFHLAALLLMVGVTVDYGLFLSRAGSPEDAGRALGAVLNCNVTTLSTFGLLLLCRSPVLQGIGATVVVGALSAIVCAVALARPAIEPVEVAGAPA